MWIFISGLRDGIASPPRLQNPTVVFICNLLLECTVKMMLCTPYFSGPQISHIISLLHTLFSYILMPSLTLEYLTNIKLLVLFLLSAPFLPLPITLGPRLTPPPPYPYVAPSLWPYSYSTL